jgi:hypothetical protein
MDRQARVRVAKEIVRDLVKLSKSLLATSKFAKSIVDEINIYLEEEVTLRRDLDFSYYEEYRGIRDKWGAPEEPDYPAHIEDLSIEPNKYLFKIPIDKILQEAKISRRDYPTAIQQIKDEWRDIVGEFKGFDIYFTLRSDYTPDMTGKGKVKGMKLKGKNIEIYVDRIRFMDESKAYEYVLRSVEDDRNFREPDDW